jgi:hypothetical protein
MLQALRCTIIQVITCGLGIFIAMSLAFAMSSIALHTERSVRGASTVISNSTDFTLTSNTASLETKVRRSANLCGQHALTHGAWRFQAHAYCYRYARWCWLVETLMGSRSDWYERAGTKESRHRWIAKLIEHAHGMRMTAREISLRGTWLTNTQWALPWHSNDLTVLPPQCEPPAYCY